jgi:PPOX class probable F420-dependent enzyme
MHADQLEALRNEKYISLTTFRRDGRAVATPVWFVIEGEHLLVSTGSNTGKVKRIRHNPEVTVAACTARGQVKGPVLHATAVILRESTTVHVERLFTSRYPVAKPVIGALNRLVRLIRRQPVMTSVGLQISLQ